MLVNALIKDTEISAFFNAKMEISALVSVEKALAQAQQQLDLITKPALEAIVTACDHFEPDMDAFSAAMAKDGVSVPELLRQLRSLIPLDYQKSLHLGATSQDIIDSALMVRLRSVLAIIKQRLQTLIELLDGMKKEQGHTPIMAHTRMQVALPFSAFDKIQQWQSILVDIQNDFSFFEKNILRIQLAGPIGNGESFAGKCDEMAKIMAKILKLHLPHSWQSNRKPIMDMGHLMSLISGALAKIGQDITLLAQNEVDSLSLQRGGSSSAMAHKHNPIIAESLVSIGRFNAGLNGTLAQAMIHENERSGAAWTLEWLVLPQICVATGAALLLAVKTLNGAKFKPIKSK